MDKHSIGKTIAQLRKAKGWTQAELAEQLNVSDKAVSKWESEAGFPEFTMFPLLANLFGVSIDYLMTGKEPEAVILTMSKAELCAKNDDVTLLDQIDPNHVDENGHNLSYYVQKYESVNVYNACGTLKMDIVENIRMALIANNIKRLEACQIKRLTRIDSKKKGGPQFVNRVSQYVNTAYFNSTAAILPEEIFHLIITDKRISQSTFLYLLSPREEKNPNQKGNIWYNGIPYLIDECIRYGTPEQLELLLQTAEKSNAFAFDNLNHDGLYGRYNEVHITHLRYVYGIVVILEQSFRYAIEQGDIALVERFNRINEQPFPLAPRFCADEDTLRIMKLRAEKKLAPKDLQVQEAIHKGIVHIDELLAINDVKLVEKTLNQYPVSIFEQQDIILKQLQQAYGSNDWRLLFEYAVDHNDIPLAKYVTEGEKEAIEHWLVKKEELNFIRHGLTVYDCLRQWEGKNPNVKYFQLRSKERFSGKIFVSVSGRPSERKDPKTIYTISDLAEYIGLCKKQVIDDLKEKNNTDKINEELSEEFFRSELAKGNAELVAIKLCVRLEAALKSKYHYEGDFSEMLEKYCSKQGVLQEDDGWGYVTARTQKFVSYLQKLRQYRNSIVHAEKKVDAMTKEDLEFCIQYICGLQ